MTLIAESNCGKSPFFRQCLDAVFVSHNGNRPCLIDTFPDRFVAPGPGKDKTLFVQTCTGSDFTKQIKGTRGHLCWLSEEAWSALDVPWAKGKGKVSPNANKVQHCFLLNTQNGCSYGPVSIQAEQFFVPTTNFAFFHAGQPKVIHDYWGQAFVKDCPFGGMGWEFRPTFLWPRSQPDDNESAPHVSFEGANRFIIDLLANLTLKYGQRLDSKNFASTPLLLSQTALPLWNKFRHCAEASKDDVPEFAAGAVGKYCFTTTSHIMACHLLEQSFLDTKDGNLSMLRSYDVTALETTAAAPMPVSMSEMPAELILAAPSHLDLMLAGVLTCFNEMKLPPAQRAGPPRLDENRCQPNRRPSSGPIAPFEWWSCPQHAVAKIWACWIHHGHQCQPNPATKAKISVRSASHMSNFWCGYAAHGWSAGRGAAVKFAPETHTITDATWISTALKLAFVNALSAQSHRAKHEWFRKTWSHGFGSTSSTSSTADAWQGGASRACASAGPTSRDSRRRSGYTSQKMGEKHLSRPNICPCPPCHSKGSWRWLELCPDHIAPCPRATFQNQSHASGKETGHSVSIALRQLQAPHLHMAWYRQNGWRLHDVEVLVYVQ